MAVDFILEIGCEEIPSAFLEPAVKQMKEAAAKELESAFISYADITTYYTPRRLVLSILGVAEKSQLKEMLFQGPPKRIAFNEEGKPTKAAEGFAKKQGVSVETLEVMDSSSGVYIYARKQVGGEPSLQLLEGICNNIIQQITFSKSMRWEESGFRFARPIRWILALLGSDVVKFQVADVKSGNFTYGHRFLAPEKITINKASDYLNSIKEANVVVDPQERRTEIKSQLTALAKKHKAKVEIDEELLVETANLTEYPVVSVGHFDEKFLHVPAIILITAMKKHQKYFPFTDSKGNLMPYFASVNNLPSGEEDLITKGNEMVLKARLADAQFFFVEDCKTPLEKKVEDLKKVVFQEQLGTIYAKVQRLESITKYLGELLHSQETNAAARAALLCKADLLTHMVYEFPELQGTMGREYAIRSGEEELVAQAIEEHYLPRFNGDLLPKSEAGALLSLAEKIDNIAGCFGVGLIPSGSQDPYALRRQALGIVDIIIKFNYRLPLKKVLYHMISLLLGKIERNSDEVISEVLTFIKLRLQFVLESEKLDHDVIKAILNQDKDDIKDMHTRALVIQGLRNHDNFNSMMVSYRRVVNILKGAPGKLPPIDEKLLTDPAEKALINKVTEIRDKFLTLVDENKYEMAFNELRPLQPYIDNFFDQVMVMVEDASMRENRFALLDEIADLFNCLADFSQIVIA